MIETSKLRFYNIPIFFDPSPGEANNRICCRKSSQFLILIYIHRKTLIASYALQKCLFKILQMYRDNINTYSTSYDNFRFGNFFLYISQCVFHIFINGFLYWSSNLFRKTLSMNYWNVPSESIIQVKKFYNKKCLKI